ncbi:1-acyl-sn-glycerol-3-phosphate acyltransferase [Marinitoga hydrogenitolerans DSM 16785]|uniref:1-acyl-sn-glycerol-3-phosphate acyltransferase n=1 Tax=Marinitoga hydrogenitolerans (strain DSM 16785 / JCM 12826 / AT1271) TaxID=1122195 RepID=A0A1M4WJ13_MARH1|nr:lysophospholipid acyltransferase family protein [Marinitoga hydrogenitolerans]SHE81239.1 1-acyl-sn-glycerol-3-phosphate acyltransferase [Marinitoga hydrogenitolerans DSM 16785]
MNKFTLLLKRLLLTIWFYVGFFGYVVIYGSLVLFISKIIKLFSNEEKANYYLRNVVSNFGMRAFKLMGIKVDVEKEFDLNTLENESYIIVANHQSLLDIPLIIGYVHPVGFIAKKELEKAPIISSYIKALGSVFIDRKNSSQAARALRELKKKLAEGKKLALFPEGTRTLDGKVKPFKRGSLMIPYRYGIKIVPVSINGTYQIIKKNDYYLTPHNVKVKIFTPVDPKKFENEEELRTYIYNLLASEVNEK